MYTNNNKNIIGLGTVYTVSRGLNIRRGQGVA